VPARVAIVHSLFHFGSTEQYLCDLISRADPAALEVWLVAPDAAVLEPLLDLSELRERVVALPVHVYRSAPRAIAAQRRALRRIRPDVVHVADNDPPALLAARLAGARRVVMTYHTPEHRPHDSLVGRGLRRAAWATRPYVIFTSSHDRETGLALDPIRPERTSVISFGLDFSRFDPKTPDGLRGDLGLDGRRVVGTVGLLRRQKAHDVLVAAAERVLREEPDVLFVVVGDGEQRAGLEQLIADRGLEDRFRLLGYRDDVPGLIAGFDVFALSSDFEGMCFAVAEAMAMEKPVVATAVGGVRQSVVEGETGLLVRPRDPDALADALLWTLRHPEEARRMGRAGGERVRRLYSLDRMVAETSALYRSLLAT
jgi:glycosyltransferase involved in cell wall biosynthesis